jgi:PAS domain S-box-containing protein
LKLQSKHIFLKSILIAVIVSIVFWFAESIAHMFFFHETFEYFLTHEPLSFMDALLYQVPAYSLLIRSICIFASLVIGAVIGILLERDSKKTTSLISRERDYHEAINAVNEGIFTYYIDDNRIQASDLCYFMLGYNPNELEYSKEFFLSQIDSAMRDRIKKSLSKHIDKCQPFAYELKMKTKSGKFKWILLKGNVQEQNEDGSARRLMGIVADISQQVKIQKKLKHYTACLEEAEKVAHVGHWEFDYKARKSTSSKEIYNILKLPLSSSVLDNARTIIKFVHPDDKKKTRTLFFKSIKDKSNFNCQYRIILEDESIKYISQRGHHVYDDNGKLIRSFGTIQDVTENSLANQKLANSEKRYRALFENVYQGIIIIDRQTEQVKLANKVFSDMFGYTNEEALNCHLQDLHPNQSFEKDSSWIKVNKKTFFGSVNCLHKSGKTFPAEVYASSIVIDKCPCIIAIFKDLTESYQAEYDRYMLKLAVDNTDVEIAVSNPDGSFDYCSPALCSRLGYTYDEMRNMSIWDIENTVKKEDVEPFWQVLKTAKTHHYEGVQVAKDGTKFEINYVADYAKISNRELICFRIQDITESKKREAILEGAKKKAEESDRLKSVFLANMSHEIRTPMNGILGFSDLLQREDISVEKSQQYAKIISTCGNNLMQMLNDILDISKIEAGEMEFKKEDFCVNKVIEELYDFYEPQARTPDKTISLHMHKSLRDNEAVIYSDERYFRQIMTNLLNNAIKFTEAGEVLFGYHAKPNGIEFFVRDSGIGIAPELLDKIFEPFRQGEEIISRKYRGSGLGLTIAKSYVEALGGYMWVESEVAKSSTFYFILPYSEKMELPKNQQQSVAQDAEYNWTGKTILVVEDNHITYMLLRNLLEDTGALVCHAETAQQGIDIAQSKNDLDLILMDVRLPDFSGWEASKTIKKVKPDLPIVVQTANATEEDKIKSFQAGCDAYLPKPIIKKQFYSTLAELIQ